MAEDGHIPFEGEVGGGLFGGTGGNLGHLPQVDGVDGIPADGFIARRGDSLGVPQTGRIEDLERRLQGTLYLGFFVDLPDRFGLGGVEVTWVGYERQPTSSWLTTLIGSSVSRRNAAAVIWPIATPTLLTVLGWGLWDTQVDGDLRAFDFLRSVTDKSPLSATFAAGRQPAVGASEIGLVWS